MGMLLFILHSADSSIMARYQENALFWIRGIDCKPPFKIIPIYKLAWKEKNKQI